MKCISCYWFEKSEVQINPDGQVFPCCFIANTTYLSKSHGYPERGSLEPREDPEGVLYQLEHHEGIAMNIPTKERINIDYIKYEDELNLKNNSIHDILNHKWFKDIEKDRESWDTAPMICKDHCTVIKDE